MKRNKILILLLTVCMALSLCACGGTADPAPSENAAPSPTASAAPSASPGAEGAAETGTQPVSKQENAGNTEQPDPVTITADEAENIAISDAMTDRGAPQNVKSYEAREGNSIIGWTVEFDLAGQHLTYLIDLVTGDILDIQFA